MRLSYRILMVGGLTLALLLPLSMIRGTVDERQRYRAEAVEEVARSTAGAQSLVGPVLFVPYSDRVVTLEPDDAGVKRPVVRYVSGTWTFYPDRIEARGTLRPLPRMRGLYEVRVFELDATVLARIVARIPQDDDPSTPRTIGPPRLGIGLRDVRGLVGVPVLRVGGVERELRQGLGQGTGGGVHAVLEAPEPGTTLALDVEFKGAVQGTEVLSIVPLGGRNVFTLDSPWPHPLFHGEFLPRTRTIGPDGFRARWEIASLATNAQGQFLRREDRSNAETAMDAIAVSLVDPVDVYTQVDRATKYGLLFVLLTFVTFFMFELFARLRIHPIQYGLVGLAIALFFLLLLALSEHVRFGLAYLIAAVGCVGLVGHYVAQVLGSPLRGAGLAAMLATLYASLYGLLVSEDNALVLGAGLLFVILATIMVLTRKVDWYRVSAATPAAGEPVADRTAWESRT